MSVTIYHNPRCSKSRKTLQLMQEAGIEPTIVEYLATPPSAERIIELATQLGMRPKDLLRRKEAVFTAASDLPDVDDDELLAAWMSQHPKVIERPIVVKDASGRAVIGRPPENVLQLIAQ